MNNLFRFILLRPPDLPASEDVRWLDDDSSEEGPAMTAEEAERFLESGRGMTRPEDATLASTALDVRDALAEGPRSRRELLAVVAATTERGLEEIVSSDGFKEDGGRLGATLLALKALSGSEGSDALGLAAVMQGYDALERLAAGVDPVRLRQLGTRRRAEERKGGAAPVGDDATEGSSEGPPPANGDGDPPEAVKARAEERLGRLDEAIAALAAITAADLAKPRRKEIQAPEKERRRGPVSEMAELSGEAVWRLSAETAKGLSEAVRKTVAEFGIEPQSADLPTMRTALERARRENLAVLASGGLADLAGLVRIGSVLVAGDAEGPDYVGVPRAPLPSRPGGLRPVGIGDLLLVKQHVLRYEGGELAHIENVLASETLSRETRRLERTETVVTTEEERTSEEERDSQSTDRFSLQRETESTLKRDSELKAGVSVSAKYGPFVEVKANTGYATSSSSEQSTRQAAEFSKDVVARSVSKVVERVLERRSLTTTAEFEERYSHGFDNDSGDNISGIYQWVDRVLQSQVYDYGKRLLFDVTVPEPATSLILAQTERAEDPALTAPPRLTHSADQVDESNYLELARRYDVGGLEPPPAVVKTFNKGLEGIHPEDPHETAKTVELAIEEGYEAKYGLFRRSWLRYDEGSWRVMVGSRWIDAIDGPPYFDMAGETGTIPITHIAYKMRGVAATVEVFCERTQRAMEAWQSKVHAAILQGYLAKQRDYEAALAEAAAEAGVAIAGRNPLWNQRLISTELRKQCVSILTRQHFDAFGALETSPEGYPQPHFGRSEEQMPYVRFFEQAFEWEHLSYFLYPYFWGWKPAWKKRMLLDDVDVQFADFLRAGAGRVVFPVRPGFESAVVHYLETGEIWNGGPAPDISDSTYVPIVNEIRESQGAPGAEVPVGEPWLVRLPTTLVRLRSDDELPRWHKVGEEWEPEN